jgi:hypothetical protein
MTDSITPPPKLVQQWLLEAHHKEAPPGTCPDTRILIARAAQWGADQELEACCEWTQGYAECGDSLRAARRPKPPTLKEQALKTLQRLSKDGFPCNYQEDSDWDTIRRALEKLPDN